MSSVAFWAAQFESAQSMNVFQLDEANHPLAERFREFVKDQAFPCVGAKSAIGRGQMTFVVARDIRSSWDDMRIYAALLEFATAYRAAPKMFQSFVVLFEQPHRCTEDEFREVPMDQGPVAGRQGRVARTGLRPAGERRPGQPPFFLSASAAKASSSSACIPTPAGPRGASNIRPWCSTCTTSSSALRAEQRYEPLRDNIIKRGPGDGGIGKSHARPARRDLRGPPVQRPARSGGDWSCPFNAKPKVDLYDL